MTTQNQTSTSSGIAISVKDLKRWGAESWLLQAFATQHGTEAVPFNKLAPAEMLVVTYLAGVEKLAIDMLGILYQLVLKNINRKLRLCGLEVNLLDRIDKAVLRGELIENQDDFVESLALNEQVLDEISDIIDEISDESEYELSSSAGMSNKHLLVLTCGITSLLTLFSGASASSQLSVLTSVMALEEVIEFDVSLSQQDNDDSLPRLVSFCTQTMSQVIKNNKHAGL